SSPMSLSAMQRPYQNDYAPGGGRRRTKKSERDSARVQPGSRKGGPGPSPGQRSGKGDTAGCAQNRVERFWTALGGSEGGKAEGGPSTAPAATCANLQTAIADIPAVDCTGPV